MKDCKHEICSRWTAGVGVVATEVDPAPMVEHTNMTQNNNIPL